MKTPLAGLKPDSIRSLSVCGNSLILKIGVSCSGIPFIAMALRPKRKAPSMGLPAPNAVNSFTMAGEMDDVRGMVEQAPAQILDPGGRFLNKFELVPFV